MNDRKGVVKRILIAILVVALIGGGAYGGVCALKHFRSGGTVYVYAMDDLIITDDWIGGEEETYGNVYTSNMQAVYVSSSQTVTEILVKEGQEVKKGDVLFSYDTTLSELNLERQRIQIQKLEKELEDQKKELQVIQTYRPGQKVKYSQLPEDSVLLGSQEEETVYTASVAGFSLFPAGISQMLGEPEAESGTEIPAPLTTEASTEETASEEQTSDADSEAPESSSESASENETEVENEAESQETLPETSAAEPESSAEIPEESESTTEESADNSEDSRDYPLLLGGSGTEEDPYIYRWTQEYQMDAAFAKNVLNGQEEAYVLFGVYMEQETDEGEVLPEEETAPSGTETEESTASFTWLMRFNKDGSYEYLKVSIGQSIYDVLNAEPDDALDDDLDDGFDDWFDGGFDDGFMDWEDDYDTVTLTAEEIAAMTTKKEQEIRSTELSLRSANLEYKKMEEEISNNKVVSSIDGTVIALNDLETARTNSEALIKISAGGGYYVQGSVGEFSLDQVQVGQNVEIMSYETGTICQGVVTEISEYPSSNGYYYSSGNYNVSYYPYTVFIDESAELMNGEEVSMMLEKTSQESTGFYLDNMFIRSENGESYVYIQAEDGTLHKQVIRTGKSLWGSYTQVLDGLSSDMNIAFPYGSSVVEGANTEVKDLDYLYEY